MNFFFLLIFFKNYLLNVSSIFKRGLSIRPFCNNLPNSYDMNSKYECDSKREAVLLCNLMRYNETIPSEYRVSF